MQFCLSSQKQHMQWSFFKNRAKENMSATEQGRRKRLYAITLKIVVKIRTFLQKTVLKLIPSVSI